jgi:hypothetical protein
MMEERGLTSYVFNQLPVDHDENKQVNGDVPGVTFTSLAAAKNEQGRLSRSLGGSFVHIELEGNVRSNEESRQQAGTAIAMVITSAPRGGDSPNGRVRLASTELEITPTSLTREEREAAVAEPGPAARIAAKPVHDEPQVRTTLALPDVTP